MKMKNSIKNIFYIIFAFCFLSAGLVTINLSNENFSKAEDLSSEVLTNESTPPYFSVQEIYVNNGTEKENPAKIDDTFLYFNEGTTSNKYKLSFLLNTDPTTNDIYKYVYYPDPTDKTVFQYFNISQITLSINGESINIPWNDYKNEYTQENGMFAGSQNLEPHGFEMTFSSDETSGNNICVLNDGNVVEGVYNISITYALFTCTDGKDGTSGEELTEMAFSEQNLTLNYSFYVLDKENYFLNNKPKINNENFDNVVSITTTNPNYAYYLYSNYSAKDNKNEIPFIEFDYTRFEANISKAISDKSYSSKISYDKDTGLPVKNGDDIVYFVTKENNICRIYFSDLGEYDVSFDTIKILNYTNQDAGISETRKYSLDGLSSQTKRIKVYMYGYQLNYTDYDKPSDSNNMRSLSELKDVNTNNGTFDNGADITSDFLNSNISYSQSDWSSTFLIKKITDYINNGGDTIKPIKTNQPPLKFSSNTKLKERSYIYSTTQASNAYEKCTGVTLNGKDLYSTKFNGKTESTTGTYIYLISYTYDNYYENEHSRGDNIVFCQVFYFEIYEEVPSISVHTIDGTNVPSETFTNQTVTINTSSITDNAYSKDVIIRLYKKSDYVNYDSEYGIAYTEGTNLEENAYYTIRLYFENEVKDDTTKLSINKRTYHIREQSFTIDKMQISNVKARNVSEILNSTNYNIVNDLTGFATNQDIVLSWDEKPSLAKTYALFRYFPLVNTQYYGTDSSNISNVLSDMMNISATDSYIPVNTILDLSETDHFWEKYYGNSQLYTNTVSTEYVLNEAGLYLVDIYDEAGNHTVECYMIDTTSPLFVIENSHGYELASPSMYITEQSTLHWGTNKAIYISDTNNNFDFDRFVDENSVSESDIVGKHIFKLKDKTVSIDLFKKIYQKIYNNDLVKNISSITTLPGTGVSASISNYKGIYITIPIIEKSYYVIRGDGNTSQYYKSQETSSYSLSTNKEMAYSVLIRDMSNTKKDFSSADDALVQYTNYSSASQTVRVSHDSSQFVIQYTPTGSSSTPTDLIANSYEISDIPSNEPHKSQKAYISPTNLKRIFSLSITPTIEDGEQKIQVDTITIKYYPYQERTVVSNGISYNFYELSDSYTEDVIYKFDGTNANKTALTFEIRPDSNNYTRDGKYEITRTYLVDGEYSYAENDYLERTYVLYVDRNEVISPTTAVTDGSNTHLESLVGGDVFVATFDNGNNSDLVVTFPNSDSGNTNGSSLYNNSNSSHPIFTTNMLPVNIYIPQYKYTSYVKKIKSSGTYYYQVYYDIYYTTATTTLYTDASRTITSGITMAENTVIDVIDESLGKISYDNSTYYISTGEFKKIQYQNFYNGSNQISEYLLYAELYKDGTTQQNLIAKTSSNYTNPNPEAISTTNGFLDFYTANGQKLVNISNAGRYYVKLYQGKFGLEKGTINANNFEQYITFSFEIKSAKPDFEIQTLSGTPLNSDGNVYYTNQPNALLLWEVGSTFMADIDIDTISFKTSIAPTMEYKYVDHKDFFKEEPYISNDLYVAEIDFKNMGIYSNNSWVDITMQFKNHDDKYYQKVTKRIFIDLTAPSENIQNLVEKSIPTDIFTGMSPTVLRKYYTAENTPTTDISLTSYNVSNDTGTYAYYSYMVTKDYLDTLKNKTFTTYVRQFKDGVKYDNNFDQETAYSSFVSSNFTEISNWSEFETGKYYEVIESDMAGNLTIYTIYVTTYQDTAETLISLKNPSNETIKYTTTDFLETSIITNAIHNIYAPTSYTIDNINYFGDRWAQFILTTYSANDSKETKAYTMTPWDSKNVYNLATGETISISNLINATVGTRFKNSISFYDRTTKQYVTFYINNRNVTFSAKFTNESTSEYIQFNMPSDQTIQDKKYASNYLTYLKITANVMTSPLYEYTNKPGYASLWTQKNEDVIISVDSANEKITFSLNSNIGFEKNTRITYEYRDNYGKEYKEVHLYNEPIITAEVQSENDLYAYYDTTGRLIYITKDAFKYVYNSEKYEVSIYDCDPTTGDASVNEVIESGATTEVGATISENAEKHISTSQGITTVAVSTKHSTNYDNLFIVIVKDKETLREVKKIYFKLHNELPEMNVETTPNTAGQYKMIDANGKNITNKIIEPTDPENLGYFSEVRLIYTTSNTFIPIKYSYSYDKTNWTEISSGTRFKCQTSTMEKYYLKIWYDETYLENVLSNTTYIYGNTPEERIYEFNLSSLTATYWIEQTIDNTITIVEKSDKIFENNGQQYSNYYIVNCNYALAEGSVSIKTNEELGIRYFKNGTPIEYTSPDGVVVTTQIYTITNTKNESGETIIPEGNIPEFETTIAITYIPESDNFVKHFYTYNMNGIIDKTEDLVNVTSKTLVVSEDYPTLDNIQIQWTKYYGYSQNTIGIKLVKDGTELDPIIYSKKDGTEEYNYLYLTHSGKYTITFMDTAGNIQKFNRGMAGQTDKFTFIFLKDVPFTVTSTDVLTGETITTEPIKQAIYNSAVTLNINPSTRSEFYSTQGYPKISVLRNAVEYTGYTGTNVEYIFEETGYYQVTFTATSNQPGIGTIRQETYEFTILDPNEYRYSYILNGYSNYYIESVFKNGVEISKNLVDSLDVSTININGKTYLKQLPLSYLDEKTGAGTYTITVNSNDKFYKGSAIQTTWTYQVKIQVGSAPIKISLTEGDSTTKSISVSFNKANVYSEMGNCTVRVVYYNDQNDAYIFNNMSYKIDSESTGEESLSINNTGTYYVQIVSNSNVLLYSYKVVRSEPMNVATIIAIVISVVVVILIIFIVIKLRKRISVK